MSLNQSRAEKSESTQYRKLGRSGSSGQPRNSSGGSGKGGGGGNAPPPSFSSNRSFKKANNAQGGQSRVSAVSVNSDSNLASAARTVQNGAHSQHQLHGESDASVAGVTVKQTDTSAQKSTRAVPKAPTHTPAINTETASPTTPTKAPGATPRSFPFQFGSITPGVMNDWQVPARTSSAPPNLDEQKRDQARHDSLRAVPTLPIPSVTKEPLPKKDAGGVDQPNSGEGHPIPKGKRDIQVSSAAAVAQAQKASAHPISGISMPMPFNQPLIPVQGMSTSSMPMQMPMPLPIGNQVQQQVFVPGLQHFSLQPPGIMHQGQSLNLSSPMGRQLPPQVSNVGINITPQFPQQQTGKFGGPRKPSKPIKITRPDTHEEVKLDKRTDMHMESGSTGPRSHHSMPPQSQPISPYPPVHHMNYYTNPYDPSLFFPAPSSLPLTSTQITPGSQAPRFNFPASRGPQTASFANRPALNSLPVNKTDTSSLVFAESSNLEHSREAHNAVSSAPASVQVTVKPAADKEKVVDSSLSDSSAAAGKGVSPNFPLSPGEVSSINQPRDSESRSSSQHIKPCADKVPTVLPAAIKQPAAAAVSGSAPRLASTTSSSASPIEESAPVVIGSSESRREPSSSSDSYKDQLKKPGKKGHSQSQHQVGGQHPPNSSLPSHSLGQVDSFSGRTAEIVEIKTASASSGTSEIVIEATGEPLVTTSVSTSVVSDRKTDSAEEGSTLESLKTLGGSGIVVQTLDTDQRAHLDERPRHETVGAKEQLQTIISEGAKQCENSLETSAESISSKSSDLSNHIEPSPVVKLTTSGDEVRSFETAQRQLEAPAGCCTEDDKVADDSVVSTSKVLDTVNAETFPSTLGLSTTSHGDKTATLDTSSNRSDSIIREAVVAEPDMLDQPIGKHEEGIQNIASRSISLSASGSKDKPVPELNRTKSTGGRGKKKRKEILQKADAAGTTSDLYMAYKGPEEKKGTVISIEMTSTNFLKQGTGDSSKEEAALSGISGQSKAEPDDWEDAADISTPKLETLDNAKQVSGGSKHHGEDGNGLGTKKYTRDFLLTFSEQCTDLPEAFDTSDIAEALMISNVPLSSESYPSPGRNNDRSGGGSRLDRRGRGMGDDDKWSKLPGPHTSARDLRLDIGFGGNAVGFRPVQGGNYGVLRNPGMQSPVQYAGGILSVPMHSMGPQGGMQRNSPDSDRWQRATAFHKGLIPSPQTPLQVMHRAERKYQVGKVTDEEEAKQRQLKAILNKLTPQNFEKLFEQVKAVNIDNAITLTGVISQIFDKALMEPTFCEMYANFCYYLAVELPDLSEDNEKITFKRLLLNKCQEEFERGEREQEEANRAEEEGEVKQTEGQREEKRIQARRRMLGNIRLIGELYKKKMLTERIMHECINKLLGQYQNPDEEDVEALCKLMSTIGEIIDHPRAKEHMDVYFDRMERLSNNMKLSSRVRFMLKDSIDLRKNKWQQRRKVEGPKKIEEVHRDAAQERQAQASRLARGPSMGSSTRRGQPMDFGPRGSNMLFSPTQMGNFRGLSPQLRGYGTQDFRHEERQPSFENRTISVPLPQRPTGDDSITLGPQGGLARGMSFRGQTMASIPVADSPHPGGSRRVTAGLNGYDQSNTQERNMNHGNRDLWISDNSSGRSLPTSPPKKGRVPTPTHNISSEKVWPEECLRDMSMAAIKEFYSANDEKEVALCVKELNAPSFYPSMVSMWVTDSFERKGVERDLLAKLLINLTKSREIILSPEQLSKGFESVLTTLEDAVNDAPKAPEFLGHIFAKVILENLITFSDIAQLIYEGGEEQGQLVEAGLAAEIVGSILEIIKSERGESALNEIRTNSRTRLEKFRPPDPSLSRRLDKFIGG